MDNVQSSAGVVDELRSFPRYARRLPTYLRDTITLEEARRRVGVQLDRREETFLELLEQGVYGNPRSPYRALLDAAGAELGDVREMIADRGLEGALATLRDGGVYATLDEFKGRKPLERSGIVTPIDHADFDNPLLSQHYWGRSSGSRGKPRRVPLDLDLLEYDAAHEAIFRAAFGLRGRPLALWRVKPPSTSGINNSLRQAKVGQKVAKWFNPYRAPHGFDELKYSIFTAYTIGVGRLGGGALKLPEYCPPGQAVRVARWLGERKGEGVPAVLDAQVGLGVRACLAAAAEGIDISGTLFRLGGEPLTEAKAAVVAASGGRAVSQYSAVETGRMAIACPNAAEVGDMHFLRDKLAVLQVDKLVGSAGIRVGALHYTTLLPCTPKVMINVESDDYGALGERACGCPWDDLGLSLHLGGVRSYEKLTSEGNHFLGSDLYALIDEVLPDRFGGAPTDYQLVEEEVGGLPKVSVVVRATIGHVQERDVVSTMIDFLRSKPRNRLMAEFWEQSDTIRVVRREPHSTPGGKTPALHIATPK